MDSLIGIGKILNRFEMKQIKAGVSSGDCYRCCLDSDPLTCSICVTCTSNCECPDQGTHLSECPSCAC